MRCMVPAVKGKGRLSRALARDRLCLSDVAARSAAARLALNREKAVRLGYLERRSLCRGPSPSWRGSWTKQRSASRQCGRGLRGSARKELGVASGQGSLCQVHRRRSLNRRSREASPSGSVCPSLAAPLLKEGWEGGINLVGMERAADRGIKVLVRSQTSGSLSFLGLLVPKQSLAGWKYWTRL